MNVWAKAADNCTSRSQGPPAGDMEAILASMHAHEKTCAAEQWTQQDQQRHDAEMHHLKTLKKQILAGCSCVVKQNCDSPLSALLLTCVATADLVSLIQSYLAPYDETDVLTPRPALGPEQRAVIQLIAEGNNVFFTGEAGTGKSFLLKQLALASSGHIVFTATTGLAAQQVSIKHSHTIHSWSAVGIEESHDPQQVLERILLDRKASRRWQDCDCLVIDEVSMMSVEMFELLELIARTTRGSERVFGGLQVVFCGDFMQLPPVKKGATETHFCFESPTWTETFAHRNCVQLKTVYRQSDPLFLQTLNELRMGDVGALSHSILCAVSRPLCNHEVDATELKCHRDAVERINLAKMKALQTTVHDYLMQDTIVAGDPHTDYTKRSHTPRSFPVRMFLCVFLHGLLCALRLNRDFTGDVLVQLCVGAQVVLIRNRRHGEFGEKLLSNGSLGRVVGFTNDVPEPLPVVRFVSVDENIIVSRVKWSIRQKKPMALRLDNPPGVDGTFPIAPNQERDEWIELASRSQLPLKLAWSLTTHRSQGQTLDKVSVDLNGTFAVGQAYVAISRARNLQSLRVVGFRKERVRSDPRCIRFMKSLCDVDLSAPQRDFKPYFQNCWQLVAHGYVDVHLALSKPTAPKRKRESAQKQCLRCNRPFSGDLDWTLCAACFKPKLTCEQCGVEFNAHHHFTECVRCRYEEGDGW